MKISLYIIPSLILLFNPNCYSREILTSSASDDYKNRIIKQPSISDAIAIPENLTQEEADALRFLYAYMATPDILDYSADYYLQNIRAALRAAEEMPWGGTVPDREWRHFVLPVRVNNENLDNSREVFYAELKDRVKDLSMKDAILEVNHWCHEKVSYQPSDARTSAPLATVKNALGRCGEESTFTVAALRSVGIPARQVYTPRWAHTDDNHAWVEAWADGKWYFLGACEPEPVLNLAWFNDPASRGMLMNTKVIGHYDGPEEIIETTPITTVINVTENYAPVTSTSVSVTDADNNPVENAEVRFSLYNYAEFFPLAIKRTGSDGYASFTSGKGDLVVWASDGEKFNFAPVTAGDTLKLVLDKDKLYNGVAEFKLIPPTSVGKLPFVTEEEVKMNDMRKAYEDSVRLSYVNTFLNHQMSDEISRDLKLDSLASDILVKSRGNHLVIEKFLSDTPEKLRYKALNLLSALAEKDLHDVTEDVLNDHLQYSEGDESSDLFVPYVLNPRIELEMLHPYKELILNQLPEERKNAYRDDPEMIAKDLGERVVIDSFNPGNFRQSPLSTTTSMTADNLNRSIAFVAICRSLGIPARIDQVSHLTQFADNEGVWHDVNFVRETAADDTGLQEKGILHIDFKDSKRGRTPKYYSQFTISRINNGVPELLEFDDFESVDKINARKQELVPGQYMIVTGQRLADGAVLARTEFFEVKPNETSSTELIICQDDTALQVIGSLNSELTYIPYTIGNDKLEENSPSTILSTTGRGYYVLGLIAPGHEPSAHVMNDIAAAAKELEETGRTILLLLPDKESIEKFRIGDYGKLPSNVVFGVDLNGEIAKDLVNGLELSPLAMNDMPVIVVADTFNRIVFFKKGYTIHTGETIADVLRSLQ